MKLTKRLTFCTEAEEEVLSLIACENMDTSAVGNGWGQMYHGTVLPEFDIYDNAKSNLNGMQENASISIFSFDKACVNIALWEHSNTWCSVVGNVHRIPRRECSCVLHDVPTMVYSFCTNSIFAPT